MKDTLGSAVVSIPIVNTITDDGIITALKLEDTVFLGMTYGAWFKVGMFVALALLIIERGISIYNKATHK